MSNSTFQFKSTSDSPARFEFVDIIKNTPRNPQDYADLQSIIRFRLASMVSELFGNCRISQVTGPFTVETVETVKYFKADGIWYIDGYRIELNDVIASNSVSIPTTIVSGSVLNLQMSVRIYITAALCTIHLPAV